MISNSRWHKVALMSIILFGQVSLNGTTNTWIADSGDWFDPSNWSLNHIPMIGETAVISDTLDEVIISGSIAAQANAVHIFGGVLTIADTAELRLDLQDQTLVGLLIDSGRVDNRGTIIIANGAGSNAYGIWIKNIGLLVNRDHIRIQHFFGFNADAIYVEFGSTLDNDGSIQISNIDGLGADGIHIGGSFLNDSTVNIDTIGNGIGILIDDMAEVINSNSLSLDHINSIGVLVSGGLFENGTGSMLSLSDIEEQGIVVENNGVLSNQLGGLIRLALDPSILHLVINLGCEFSCHGTLDITLN